MPLPGPHIPRRRGRPRRKGLQIQNDQRMQSDNNHPNVKYLNEPNMYTNGLQQSHSTSVYDKLREERSYKEFYPDLNITQTLTIVRRTSSTYSDELAPLMNDTAITTRPSAIPIDTTTAPPSPVDTNNKEGQSLSYADGITRLSSNKLLDDINLTSTSSALFEGTPTTTLSTALHQQSCSPTTIHAASKEKTGSQALTTGSPIHRIKNTDGGTVDLIGLPKASFRKVIDDVDEPLVTTKLKISVVPSTSTKGRRNSYKRKRNLSNELSSDTALESDTEHDNGDKGIGDNSDGGNDATVKNMNYRRPEHHYIRYIEPTEQSLFDMVEYDMDEQDDAWLQMLNMERKINRLGHVSCSFFENVIDKLEKEWFNLIKHLPKETESEPLLSEDSACSICDDGECENSNAIVFCDGCNLAVHQDCYGVPYIPEGQWLCRKCMVSPDKPVSCLFCPNEGGAFKQTNTNKWGHLLCALWIPEVGVSNSVYMEPIDNIEGIPKSRWKLTCYICKKRHGACIQCDNKHCFTAFHVTCARWARLCMRMKTHGSHSDNVLLKAYCDRHTPRDYREEVDVEKCVLAAQHFLDPKALKNQGRPSSSCTPRRRYVDELDEDMEYDADGDVDDDNVNDNCTTENHHYLKRSSTTKRKRNDKKDLQRSKRRQTMATSQQLTPSIKAARAHQHHYSAGAPIAPDFILTRLENLKCVRQAVHLRRRCQLIASICRYWSLKRESRRGAPLLKRLHLEPWTASSSQLKQNELEKAQRAKALFELRADLEVVRMLSEQVQKREKQKLEKLRRQKEYIEMILFPVEYIVRPILNRLMEMDKKDYFLYPVTPDVAPDYLEFIDHPMSFQDIIEKFHAHEYITIDAVEADLSLIWTNSMTYNESDTSYYKLAQRMKEQATELITEARHNYKILGISQHTGALAVGIDPDIFSYNLASTVPLATERKMETGVQSGHSQSENQSEKSRKNEGMAPTNKPTESISSKESTSTSKRQAGRSTEMKKRLDALPKRTTRSSSTDIVHINLDDRLRKRKKRFPRLLSSPSTPTPKAAPSSAALVDNLNVPEFTPSEVPPPTTTCVRTPKASTENHTIESTVMPSSSSSTISSTPLPLLPLSSEQQSPAPLSLEQQSPAPLSSEQPSSLSLSIKQQTPTPLSSEQLSSAPLSSEQPSSLSLSIKQQSSPPLSLSLEQRSSSLLSSEQPLSLQQAPPPLPSELQSLPLLLPKQQLSPPLLPEQQESQLQQQSLVDASTSKLPISTISTTITSPALPPVPSRSSSRTKRSSKLITDNVVLRRRTRSTGSDGLTIPTKSGMKDRKMNKETRKLLMPDTMDKPVAYEEGSYKESKTRRAPCGYVYISSDDDDGDDNEGDGINALGAPRNGSRMDSSTASSTRKKSAATSHSSTIESDAKLDDITDIIEIGKLQQPTTVSTKKTQTTKTPLFSTELRTTTPGEIVWARVPGFPFHPAKIVDVEEIEVSKKLLANRTKEKTVLVKFYQVPESHKWGWINPTNVYKFGNEENDRIMLEQAKVVKRNKKSRSNEVFEGYEYVCMKLGLKALKT